MRCPPPIDWSNCYDLGRYVWNALSWVLLKFVTPLLSWFT
jgi:hypothetical protein